jgi:ribonuclease R
VGERSGESYRLGDRVDVRLVEANPAAGALRFEMMSDGRYSPALAKAQKKRGGKAARKTAKASPKRSKQKE